jgi:hypothetical protein
MPRMTTGGTWTYPPGWTMYWKSGRMSQPVFGAGEHDAGQHDHSPEREQKCGCGEDIGLRRLGNLASRPVFGRDHTISARPIVRFGPKAKYSVENTAPLLFIPESRRGTVALIVGTQSPIRKPLRAQIAMDSDLTNEIPPPYSACRSCAARVYYCLLRARMDFSLLFGHSRAT